MKIIDPILCIKVKSTYQSWTFQIILEVTETEENL
jgi:hypothetical protein